MALGKIKADTLEHSTAGSLDTSYVVNGSAKAWNNTNSAGTTINNSFNISSLGDAGTGIQTHNVTNSFSDANTVPTFTVDNNENQQWTSGLTTSAWSTRNYTGSSYVDASVRTVCQGDLA
jgi:hypothetical protein